MNKIIVVSPHSDESKLVEELSNALGSSIQVSVVDSLTEALAVDGVAIISHFAKGLGDVKDLVDLEVDVIVASHSRDWINKNIETLLSEEDDGGDGSSKLSKFSAEAWKIFSFEQRHKHTEKADNGISRVRFINCESASIFSHIDDETLQNWRAERNSNNTSSDIAGDQSVPSETGSDNQPKSVAEESKPEAVAEPEQVAVETIQAEAEMEQATEVQPQPEVEQPTETQWEETETEASKSTPLEEVSLDAFDPFKDADIFNSSIEAGIEAEKKLNEAPKEDSVKVSKYRAGINPNYPDVEHTVNIQINPLKPLTDRKPNVGAYLADWAGASETMDDVVQVTSEKFANAQRFGNMPRLTEVEKAAVDIQSDLIGSSETHKFQYVQGSAWSQGVATQTVNMPLIVPIKNPTYGDKKYVGADAVPLLRNRMKIGATLGVFLPHSGIYCIIVSPTDGDLLDTLSIINTQRIETLRSSSGILMGNSNYYIHRQVMDLFLNSITNCSFRSWNREQLLEIIDERDINIIATALMASIYPDGYDYVQSCGLRLEVDESLPEEERAKQEGEICGHRSEFTADLIRTIFVDNKRLNEFQRNVAVSAIHARTLEEIKDYQNQHYIGYKKAYEVAEGISFTYRAQNIKTSMEAGEKWIGEISAIVDSIITFKSDDEERNTMIDHRINLARIREFSHWVESIEVDGNELTDREKINALLSSLSRNAEVMRKVGETLSEFQRLSVIAITAIPRVKCPICQKTETRDLDIAKHLIPQDAVSRLFTLVRQRV